MSDVDINKLSLIYTRCYCEENIWKLCHQIRSQWSEILGEFYVVFISNHQQFIPLWCQKASDKSDGFIVWDYHVILVHKKSPASLVYDFDTTLNFPSNFDSYVSSCIKYEDNMLEKYHRLFRVIKAEDYLDNFASDRSHMKNPDESWKMPPPPYPPIATVKSTNNLKYFISMDQVEGISYGSVMKLKEFIEFISPSDNKSELSVGIIQQVSQF